MHNIQNTTDGKWASDDVRDGFIYDYERIASETGYTVAQVKMYGVSYCRRTPNTK